MKRFLSILAFSLLVVASVAAQGNGNNWNCNNGNGNGGNGNAYGQANSPWANANWPQWLVSWLENGGQIPQILALDVIWEARAWGMQNFSLNYPQMLQKYAQGQLTLEYISTSPPSLTFRVRFGGISVVVIESL